MLASLLLQAFLDIPRYGTINIHPSLLPKYRGAAPVQRCLEAGDSQAGVSLVYTVLKCDAGSGNAAHTCSCLHCCILCLCISICPSCLAHAVPYSGPGHPYNQSPLLLFLPCPFTHAPRITGPILDQSHVSVGSDVQAPELTSRLFQLGSKMLLARMGDILSERGRGMTREQDSSVATYARKVGGIYCTLCRTGRGA